MRYRKESTSVLTKDTYNDFVKSNPDIKVSYKEYRKIVEAFNLEMVEIIKEDIDGIMLPKQLGVIFIGGYEPSPKSSKPIDFKKTKEFGRTIYHDNWETDGKVCKIFYIKNTSNYANSFVWKFIPHRNFARAASKLFKENYQRFRNIPYNISLNKMF